MMAFNDARRELQGALVRERVPFRGFPDLERRSGAPAIQKDDRS